MLIGAAYISHESVARRINGGIWFLMRVDSFSNLSYAYFAMAKICPTTGIVTYSAANPYPSNCKSRLGFDFGTLQTIVLSIFNLNPSDTRLYRDQAALTDVACREIAGSDHTNYSASDIWLR